MDLNEIGWAISEKQRANAENFYIGQVVVWKAGNIRGIIQDVCELTNHIEVMFEDGAYGDKRFNCSDLSMINIAVRGEHG